ncbi:hypothetical protein ADUPG1_008039 [Aduncisulcus paluster]|uniref:Uncharacterized protein n=1 Tax=Aduncisulcus paluster TaxID=2918883 RepID=A0ABQ5KQI4_9EUKA|nr:hypothetical protein ADUPG1_008039 [Aduncisulcus paluster]
MKPQFICYGDEDCCPIPGDSPSIMLASFPIIQARNETRKEGEYGYSQIFEAQKMMKGGGNYGEFTHISIPFASSSRIEGAYICLDGDDSCDSPPSHLIFTFTSSEGEKLSKKYDFPDFEECHWYFLPVNLPDVVLCEITGKGREEEYFTIKSLVFISRKETPEEIFALESEEKLWSETPVVNPEFVKEGDKESKGRDSIPIPRDDLLIKNPLISMVNGKDTSKNPESEYFDQTLDAQRMLKGKCEACLSHLFIPFSFPNSIKGAYICVHKDWSSSSLLFTFTDYDGKKTSKRYEFTEPKHEFEWHFLPIDLFDVVLCEIQQKGRWNQKNSRCFVIYSLVFTKLKESEIIDKLPLLPWK